MTVHLIHGFNVRDKGKGTLGNLKQSLVSQGYDCKLHDIGFIGLVLLRFKNKRIAAELVDLIKSGDSIVAHSNGCLITWMICQLLEERSVRIKNVVTINAAMRRDTVWPAHINVLNLYSSKDWVVRAGRVWSRVISFSTFSEHGWGAAGYFGFTANQERVVNWDTAAEWFTHPTKGHSDLFKPPAFWYWGKLIGEHWRSR